MRTLDPIAERRIREAIERCELEDRPGAGRPLRCAGPCASGRRATRRLGYALTLGRPASAIANSCSS